MSTDSTTTLLNEDFDEDKTLFLTPQECLQYFAESILKPVHKPLSRKQVFINYIKKYLH